ncbi:endolytic transglycosylase MltG [Gordonia crocea]|nr:endolytic transglycosylase MltG [Gordonia crocea]
MTGQVDRVDDDAEPSQAEPSRAGGAAEQAATPNIVRHVDRATTEEIADEQAEALPEQQPQATPELPEHEDQPAPESEPVKPASPATTDSDDIPLAPKVPVWHSDLVEQLEAGRAVASGTDPDRMPQRRSRRGWIAAAVVGLVAVLGGGYLAADRFGLLASDYSDTAGSADVLVTIPDNSTLTRFGEILTDNGVVSSSKAFIRAADGQPLSGGIYKLRKGVSAATAVGMMTDSTHRVGRLVVPEGVQLESKRGVDGKTIPGVFSLIADATAATVNGQQVGVSVADLESAAKSAAPDALGVPTWAREAVDKLPGDYRRIEGLIAPGTWEAVDPQAGAADILKKLITDSAQRYESWGLLTNNRSGLQPYEVLVAASVAEREVRDTADLPKVARVILNRLAKKQRLEMDSTTNYTAAETNIDVHGDNYKANTRWNTYRVTGLPPTPIATVGELALKAMLDPPQGDWLYFITVDKQGTTKFSATFQEHLRNRKIACANKFLKTGC